MLKVFLYFTAKKLPIVNLLFDPNTVHIPDYTTYSDVD